MIESKVKIELTHAEALALQAIMREESIRVVVGASERDPVVIQTLLDEAVNAERRLRAIVWLGNPAVFSLPTSDEETYRETGA